MYHPFKIIYFKPYGIKPILVSKGAPQLPGIQNAKEDIAKSELDKEFFHEFVLRKDQITISFL